MMQNVCFNDFDWFCLYMYARKIPKHVLVQMSSGIVPYTTMKMVGIST